MFFQFPNALLLARASEKKPKNKNYIEKPENLANDIKN